MKKNLIIVILVLFTVLSMFYSYVKASEAENAMIMAEEQKLKVEELKDEANLIRDRAQQAAADAIKQKAIAEDALKHAEESRQKLLVCQSR
ncbi:MAG: hypothetical protein AAF391_11545 [Bacteroidota bacterium]